MYTGGAHPGVWQAEPEETAQQTDDLLSCASVGFLLVEVCLSPVSVESAVPERFVRSVGVVALEEFVTLRFVVLAGLVGAGVFLFVGPLLLFARIAHVLLQYGYTVVPSLYLVLV